MLKFCQKLTFFVISFQNRGKIKGPIQIPSPVPWRTFNFGSDGTILVHFIGFLWRPDWVTKKGYPAISMPISVQGRENHSNKWRYRTRFWATGRLNSKFLRVTRGHKGSTWPQLTPHWPYGVNIRYQVNVMWYDLEYVIWLIFRSETECDLYFALKISQHTFLVTISRS